MLKLVWLLIAACFLLATVTKADNAETAEDSCAADDWSSVFSDQRLKVHFPLLTNFNRETIPVVDEETNELESTTNHSAVLKVFDFSLPADQKHFVEEEGKEALKHHLTQLTKETAEDVVIRVSVFTETGLVIHSDSFWDEEAERAPFTMPPRKDFGPGFRIESPFEIKGKKIVAEGVSSSRHGEFPTKVTPLAHSHEHYLVRGLDYRVDWELEVADRKKEAKTGDLFFKYLGPQAETKHTPSISFDEPSYLYLTMGDIHDLEGDDEPEPKDGAKMYSKKVRLKENYATLSIGHSAVKPDDEAHSISVVFVEDEYGRVIFYKELDATSEEDKDEQGLVKVKFDMFSFGREFRTMTPYMLCTKDGLYQGPMVVIPYVDEESCVAS